jgi:RNA polymerase sigma-70 factor (ECF subfamily)
MASTPAAMPAAAEAFGAGADVDRELVRRMQGGDERALGAFYDRWFPVVNCLVTRMLKAPDEVEDVVEETFWQVWRQATRFEAERGSVQTWLLTIARSRALDRMRASRRRREDAIDEGKLDDANATAAESYDTPLPNDPSLEVEHAERRRIVRAALSELPAEQREALELGYFGGLSQSEIAERTGQPLGTVKTRMRLAIQKLRDRLIVLREDAP